MKQSERAVFEQPATLESWDKDYYHPIAERLYDQAISHMLGLMGAPVGARVLDAGCGPGVHTRRVALAGYRVCAIDVSQTMLKEARRRIAAAGLESAVEFRQEDLTALTLPDASFQYVFSWGVIIHIHDVEKALDELVRIVAPGGKLALYVTNSKSLDTKMESLARSFLGKPLAHPEYSRLGDGNWYEMHGERLWVRQFDIPELQRQLELRGLYLTHRVIGEFSEIQRRVGGGMRSMLLLLNNLCYRINVPPGLATANLLVFEKKNEVNAESSPIVR